MANTLFECGNEKCSNTTDPAALSQIQLKVLRKWVKTCPKCGKQTHWQEKVPMLDSTDKPQPDSNKK